ncbi:MAG: phosphoglycerate mutase [Desulfotalea sp.]|nr:MAG: phosphoglycerate mutase [Desulfotalea sp.]
MDTRTSAPQDTSLFGLLRHGETEWNAVKRIQGLSNSQLTARGIRQTKQWAQTLGQWEWDQIYASDLGRVQETVAILNESLGLPTHFDTRLREQNWGEWEGRTIASIKTDFKKELQERVALGWGFSAPGGETRTSVLNRAFEVLHYIAGDMPPKKTLIVCHQGVIKTILYHLKGRQFLPEEEPLIQHNNLHLIDYNQVGFNINTLNIPRQGEKPRQ